MTPLLIQAIAVGHVKNAAISGSTQNRATPTSTPPPKGTSRFDRSLLELRHTPTAALHTAKRKIARAGATCYQYTFQIV